MARKFPCLDKQATPPRQKERKGNRNDAAHQCWANAIVNEREKADQYASQCWPSQPLQIESQERKVQRNLLTVVVPYLSQKPEIKALEKPTQEADRVVTLESEKIMQDAIRLFLIGIQREVCVYDTMNRKDTQIHLPVNDRFH